MYSIILALHSSLRWLVLLAGLIATVRSLRGWRASDTWGSADNRAGLWFTVSLDAQFLLGLLLYTELSPLTRMAFADFGAAMANSALRFWAVEHVIGMTVALVFAHVGRARVRRADATRRHRMSFLFLGLALLAALLTTPWPGLPYGRPLLPSF